jgi:hypothetical protein
MILRDYMAKRLNKKKRIERRKLLRSGEYSTGDDWYVICGDCEGAVDYCLLCEANIGAHGNVKQFFCGDGGTKESPQHICEDCADEIGLFDEDEVASPPRRKRARYPKRLGNSDGVASQKGDAENPALK